jgi:predicted transcriptional regulator
MVVFKAVESSSRRQSTLPERAEVRLALVEPAIDEEPLDVEDLARLDAAIAKGRQEIAEGRAIPAEQVVAELWATHRR